MHEEILDQIQQRWNAAAATWDVKALARIYTSDALFFGLLPKLYIGRDQVEDYFSSYKDRLKAVQLTLVRQNFRSIGTDVFLAQGFGDIVNCHLDGSVRHNTVRSSLVMSSNGSQWQIALHHFSECG